MAALLEVPAGQRNQYLVDVILEKDERETLRKLIQETVREELKSGGMEQMPRCEKEEIPGQMLDFYFRWSRSKGVRPMGKESMALLDMLGFCIHLTWIL